MRALIYLFRNSCMVTTTPMVGTNHMQAQKNHISRSYLIKHQIVVAAGGTSISPNGRLQSLRIFRRFLEFWKAPISPNFKMREAPISPNFGLLC